MTLCATALIVAFTAGGVDFVNDSIPLDVSGKLAEIKCEGIGKTAQVERFQEGDARRVRMMWQINKPEVEQQAAAD